MDVLIINSYLAHGFTVFVVFLALSILALPSIYQSTHSRLRLLFLLGLMLAMALGLTIFTEAIAR